MIRYLTGPMNNTPSHADGRAVLITQPDLPDGRSAVREVCTGKPVVMHHGDSA